MDADDEVTAAGDPVCWLDHVCDVCGALPDGPPEPVCPRCGARRRRDRDADGDR